MSTTPHNRLRGIVRWVEYDGPRAHVTLETSDGGRFTTVLMAATADRLDVRPGDDVEATVHVAELVANGRRAQSVVRTSLAASDGSRPDYTTA